MQEEVQSALIDNEKTSTEATSGEEQRTSDGLHPLASVTAERDQLAQEKLDLGNQLLRARAEFDNYRKRAERERQEFAEYAGAEIVRALLPTIDDFERALSAAANTDVPAEFLKGVELIYQRMLDTLIKQGLEPIPTESGRFDPHLHYAVQKEESAEVEEDTIVEEFQRGYNFKGKLLRPSMVKVAVRR
jgi:molecular chaperone GrpE